MLSFSLYFILEVGADTFYLAVLANEIIVKANLEVSVLLVEA